MLNEKFEYKEYTDKEYLKQLTAAGKSHRLNYNGIVLHNNSGLSRPLTVIAKYIMAENGNDDKDTEMALKAWLGKNHEDHNDFSAYFNKDLMNHYRQVNGSEKKNQSIDEYLNKNYEDFMRRFNYTYTNNTTFAEKTGTNDQNAVTFENIYYTVRNKPLRDAVLVSDIDIFNVYNFKCEGKDLKADDKDHILKIIAAYLLHRAAPDAHGVKINVVDIGNWSLKQYKNYKIDIYKYGEKDLVKNIDSRSGQKIIRIEDEIIDHFRIVDRVLSEEMIKADDIVYIDHGHALLEMTDKDGMK